MSQTSPCGNPGGTLAIVSIDLVGYSRLMEEDERGTHGALMACRRDILEPIVAQHDGHIIKSTGDGALITFSTADDAVKGMIAFQDRVALREAKFPKSRRLVFRIGIHLAEAIYDDGDLYGHGVNLAVRLQEAAEPGSIYLSDVAVKALPNETAQVLGYLGQRTFKNLSNYISIYRWQGLVKRHQKKAGWQFAALAATAFLFVSTPTEPSKIQIGDDIDDRSDDRPGSTSDQRLDIAVWSTESLKTKSNDNIIAEGTMNALPSDLAQDNDLNRSDSKSHISEAQIVELIASDVAVNAQISHRNTKILNSFAKDAYIQAWTHYARNSPQGLRWAVNDLSKSIELDPTDSQAHALLAACYWTIWQNHWQRDLRLTASEVMRLAQKHLKAVNGSTAMAHAVASEMFTASGRHLDALAEAEHAISADPTAASGYYAKGLALIFNGEPADGEKLIRNAIQKNPYLPKFLFGLALSQFNTDRFDDALSTLSYATERNAKNDWLFFLLAATYGQLGKEEKARAALERFKKLGGQRRGWVENYLPYLHTWPFREEEDRLRMRDGLLNADASDPFRLAVR